MKSLKDIEIKGKKVVMRAGYDLPFEYGEIVDDVRIKESLETVEHIVKQKPSLFVIINHIGRPGGRKEVGLSNSIVAERLQNLLYDAEIDVEVEIIETLEALDVLAEEEHPHVGKVYMLENIRFWTEEKDNNDVFSEHIGKHFDIYVNDAFSVSHRAHASFVGIPKYTANKCMGLLFEKEYENLTRVKDNPDHPAVMIIGGAKIATKLPVIENMMKVYDKVLVGGMVANEVLDQEMDLGEKVLLPVDFLEGEGIFQRLDIGPETIKLFVAEIEKAKTVVWNGPLGKFEDEKSAAGTKAICEAVAANNDALQVIGGGETLDAVKDFSSFSEFDYVSMSGGAMLKYLSGEELPGIKALG